MPGGFLTNSFFALLGLVRPYFVSSSAKLGVWLSLRRKVDSGVEVDASVISKKKKKKKIQSRLLGDFTF